MTNHLPNPPIEATTIAIIAYDGVQMSAVLGLEDLFTIANRLCAVAQLHVTILSTGDVVANLGGTYGAIILPPNINAARGAGDAAIHSFLRHQHQLGSTICSACAGVFWLAESGLLSGRAVTTHWALVPEFAEKYPNVRLLPDEILIDERDIVTAGGMMAWLDLGLSLVERHLGAQVMTDTARHLLMDPRGRRQANYRAFRPRTTHGDGAISELQHWMAANVDGDLSIATLASQTPYAERTFIRKFSAATGLSPNAYVQALRVEKSRAMLEQTRRSVQAISWDVGYHDVSAFGRVFKSITGTSPAEYRTRFGVMAPGRNDQDVAALP